MFSHCGNFAESYLQPISNTSLQFSTTYIFRYRLFTNNFDYILNRNRFGSVYRTFFFLYNYSNFVPGIRCPESSFSFSLYFFVTIHYTSAASQLFLNFKHLWFGSAFIFLFLFFIFCFWHCSVLTILPTSFTSYSFLSLYIIPWS